MLFIHSLPSIAVDGSYNEREKKTKLKLKKVTGEKRQKDRQAGGKVNYQTCTIYVVGGQNRPKCTLGGRI